MSQVREEVIVVGHRPGHLAHGGVAAGAAAEEEELRNDEERRLAADRRRLVNRRLTARNCTADAAASPSGRGKAFTNLGHCFHDFSAPPGVILSKHPSSLTALDGTAVAWQTFPSVPQ